MGAASLAGLFWRMTAKKVTKSIWLSDAFRHSRSWVEFRLLEILVSRRYIRQRVAFIFGIAVVTMVV